MKKNETLLGSLMLLISAMVWGFAFVFQSEAMDFIGPLTLTCIRMFLGGLVLLPICFILNRKMSKTTIRKTVRAGMVCGIVLAAASLSQQYGIPLTTVGKSSFITALYIIIIPIISALFLHRKVTLPTWICVLVALLGFYLLSFTPGGSINVGDIIIFLSAVLYSFHILVIDHFADNECDGTLLSCVQFLTVGLVTFFPMLLIDHPTVTVILDAKISILYMGLCSCGIGYTFQTLAQSKVPPVPASLIMCLESVFGALGGAIFLQERFTLREGIGCALLFGAVLAVNLIQVKKGSKSIE